MFNIYNPLSLMVALIVLFWAWVIASLPFGWVQTSGWATLAFTVIGVLYASGCGQRLDSNREDEPVVKLMLAWISILSGIAAVIYCNGRGDLTSSLMIPTILLEIGVFIAATLISYIMHSIVFAYQASVKAEAVAIQ